VNEHRISEHIPKRRSNEKDVTMRFVRKCEDSQFKCKCCGKKNKSKQNILEHLDLVHEESTWKHNKCHLCPKMYGYRRNLRIHLRERHGLKQETCCICKICDKKFIERNYVRAHLKKSHVELDVTESSNEFIQDNFNINFPKTGTRS
jgi:hypothetical protein